MLWGTTVVMIGYLAGASYQTVAQRSGWVAGAAVLAIAVTAVGVWQWRRLRARSQEQATAVPIGPS